MPFVVRAPADRRVDRGLGLSRRNGNDGEEHGSGGQKSSHGFLLWLRNVDRPTTIGIDCFWSCGCTTHSQLATMRRIGCDQTHITSVRKELRELRRGESRWANHLTQDVGAVTRRAPTSLFQASVITRPRASCDALCARTCGVAALAAPPDQVRGRQRGPGSGSSPENARSNRAPATNSWADWALASPRRWKRPA